MVDFQHIIWPKYIFRDLSYIYRYLSINCFRLKLSYLWTVLLEDETSNSQEQFQYINRTICHQDNLINLWSSIPNYIYRIHKFPYVSQNSHCSAYAPFVAPQTIAPHCAVTARVPSTSSTSSASLSIRCRRRRRRLFGQRFLSLPLVQQLPVGRSGDFALPVVAC